MSTIYKIKKTVEMTVFKTFYYNDVSIVFGIIKL